MAEPTWRAGRDDLFGHHPASPLPAEARRDFTGLPVAPYDPHWRCEVPVEPAEPSRIEMSTGSDGGVPFERIGRVGLPGGETLDVWRLLAYNPSCAYDPAWACRLAPPGNVVRVEIGAGELYRELPG
jgi:hypothetical protein